MKIETERLFLYPISDEEIKSLIKNENDPDLRHAYSEMLSGCINKPEHRIWYTVWLIELKSPPRTIAGDFCFKGLNPDGMVEIGYGLREGFCKKGFMTEAVRAVCEWALAQPGVKKVEAETAPENSASQRVLAACGFIPDGTLGEEGPRFVFDNSRK